MVKIDWNKEEGFSLADAGVFKSNIIGIDCVDIAGILTGYIAKNENGIFRIDIYKDTSRDTVHAAEPGFDGIIKALNGHDWSSLIEDIREDIVYNLWTPYDEYLRKQEWLRAGDQALAEGKIGIWTWYARTGAEIYDSHLSEYKLREQWGQIIKEREDLHKPVIPFCIGKALDKGFSKEEAIHANGTSTLWLQGKKRRAVVGMQLFYAIAALGVDVVVYQQRRQLPPSVRVMEGDDIQGLAGVYASFSDVEIALVLQRLCGKKLTLKDLDKHQVERVKDRCQDVKFAKNLHSEVAANLEMVLVACRLLKLKGLVEGSSLAEALCNAAGVDMESVELILNGHKRRYLPHAIWATKKAFCNAGSMPAFVAGINGMSLSKLPESDLVNLYIGDITGCCQHLDGAGKRVCKEGWIVDHNCNYVFRSASNSIIAHMWVWLDSNGNLVVDSIEARSFADKESIASLLKTFAQEMGVKGHKVLIRKLKYSLEDKVAEILGLEEVAEAGKTLHGKDWGYSDTDPGDECYIVE